jgi:hypothetical protein
LLSLRIDTVEGGYDKLVDKIMDLTIEFAAFHHGIAPDKIMQQITLISSTNKDQQSSIDDLYYPPRDKLHIPTQPVVKPLVVEPPQTIQLPTTDSQLSNDKIVHQTVHPMSHNIHCETQEFGTYSHQLHHPANVLDKSISRAPHHQEELPHCRMAL